MIKRLLDCLAVAILYFSDLAHAQFTDPHNYDNTAVGTNQIELAYTYARSDVSIDTGLVIAGAKFNLNVATIDYSRYFGLANHLMWVNGAVPIAGLSGSVTGTTIRSSITGAADSSYQVAALLKGGPALSKADFDNYKPETIVGVSLSVAAPSGQYNGNKIVNLGSDRWLIRPEIALSHPFGPEQKWQLDTYANCEFYTDDTSYRGIKVLSEQPLPGFEGHVSYTFNDKLWAAIDTRYSLRGDTSINGADQNDSQQNFIIGSEVNLALNSQHSLVFEFAKALAHRNGTAYTGFTVKYDFVWGKGYRTKR
ncbi:MAG TPA: transporter [Terriglobales bacterium]|nr:transporter [Terriglobales bacterium]